MATDDKTDDKTKQSILSSILGFGTTIGGQIPGLLKKNSEGEQLRKMQQGKGAGAQAVKAVSRKTAEDMATIAGAGRSGSRGLALTAALRAGGKARMAGAAQAAQVAAGESERATAALRSDDATRKANIAKVGGAIGSGMAQFGASKLLSSINGEDVDPELQAKRDAFDAAVAARPDSAIDALTGGVSDTPLPEDDTIGLDDLGAMVDEQEQDIYSGQQGLDRLSAANPNSPTREPFREQTRSYENEQPLPEPAPQPVAPQAEEAGLPQVDPRVVALNQMEARRDRVLSGPEAALKTAAGQTPDQIMDAEDPFFNARLLNLRATLAGAQ